MAEPTNILKSFLGVDVRETAILNYDRSIMDMLLLDRTTGKNILWGTDDYKNSDDDAAHACDAPITADLITGDNDGLIKPRSLKTKDAQRARARNKAEVFTPAWVCNAQNNLVDEVWFGRKNVFNEPNSSKDSPHEYTLSPRRRVSDDQKVIFPKGKSWQDYVLLNRMEITCGEAPYLVNRYDSDTGKKRSNIRLRIGLLDRKLRVICENAADKEEWLIWVKKAYQHIYGFEWQGDNLLLARENLMLTFFDYYSIRFGEAPSLHDVREIVEIISWNVWQMDGLTFQVPYTSKGEFNPNPLFVSDNENFCRIRDWDKQETLCFASLIKKGERK